MLLLILLQHRRAAVQLSGVRAHSTVCCYIVYTALGELTLAVSSACVLAWCGVSMYG